MKVLRTAFLLTALTLVLLVVGDALGGANGIKVALTFAVFMNASAYFFSDKIALSMYRAKPVTRERSVRPPTVRMRLIIEHRRHPRKRMTQYTRSSFGALMPQRESVATGCPAFAGHDKP